MKSILTVCLFAGALVGCASEPTCDYAKEPYVAARSVPELRAPEGLSTPDRTATLVIPDLGPNAPPIPTGDNGQCLDRPPSYFATNTDAKDAAKSTAKDAEQK